MRSKPIKSIASAITHWHPPETVILLGMSVFVGLATGIGIWLFKGLIDFFQHLFFEEALPLINSIGPWTVALIPVTGGLIVGLLVHFFIGPERHHGVAGIIEATALAGGRLRYHRIPAKASAAALSIGAGASVGPEDPSVQIGSNLGSMLGQLLHVSEARTRMLVAAGAAGGVAAAFNAPIAGVFFALEIILGQIGGSAFAVVVIASVTSAVFTQAVEGIQPAFRVPAYAFNSEWELPLYLALGIFAGPVSAIYVRLLYTVQDFFHAWRIPNWLKPTFAGAAVGLTGIFLPQIFGIGYESIEQVLSGAQLSIGLLLILLLAKLILTPVSIGGGFQGGVFAPSLFLGAMLGSAFGQTASLLFPGLPIEPPAYAMVGMAAVLAGTVHAPLTAILLLFEMTNDYHIILPLMFAVAISLAVSQLIQRDSVYMLGLARKGIRLERGRDVELLERITVQDVMQTELLTLNESTSLDEAAQQLMETRHHGLPVTDDSGKLVGILTVQDIDRAHSNHLQNAAVGDVCTRELIVVYTDESIGDALRKMGARDIGRVPVVLRNDSTRLVGLLRRSDIIRAYDIALTRRAALRHRAHQVRLGHLSGDAVSVVEIRIENGSQAAEKRIREINCPKECIIASLRRGRRLVIPHGDTILQPGDVLMAVVDGKASEQLEGLCRVYSDNNGSSG